MIILYAVPISLLSTLGKENRYFYTRHPNINDRWLYTLNQLTIPAHQIKISLLFKLLGNFIKTLYL